MLKISETKKGGSDSSVVLLFPVVVQSGLYDCFGLCRHAETHTRYHSVPRYKHPLVDQWYGLYHGTQQWFI